MLHRNWYPVVDVFTTKYYQVIVNLTKEIDIIRKYLDTAGNPSYKHL